MTIRLLRFTGDSLRDYAIHAGMMLYTAFFFAYDILDLAILKPCCTVLISYVRQEQDVLNSILGKGIDKRPAKITDVSVQLERVRLNLFTIAKLRKVLNMTWQFSILMSAVVLLVVSCVTIHTIFDGGLPTDQFILTISYCCYITVDFVDVTRLSQRMADEVSVDRLTY